METYRGENPTLSSYTDMPAYFTKGYTALAEAASRAGGNLGRFATPGNPLGDFLRVGTPAVAVSGIPAASQALSEGESPENVIDAGLSSAKAGLELMTPIAAAARLTGGVGRAVVRSRGGQARQFIERHGGEVGPTTPGRGGPFENMETLGTRDADIGLQGEVSARKGLGMLNEEQGAVQGVLGRRIGTIDNSPDAASLRDVSGLVAHME